ncbi:MAG: cytochrome c biogenesis protein CcdA [Anaerolineae bacterium]|nr:cytochrome c biogenesis protein CcdA [Anaerolineae bacterium]
MKRILSTEAVWPSKNAGPQTKENRRILVATFVVPALLVVGVLFLLVSFHGGIENAIADLAHLLPVGYAFAAGMVASVNPCGIIVLTSYAFYQVREEAADSPVARRVLWGIIVSGAIVLGFVLIFAFVGGAIAVGGQWLAEVFPYAGLSIGAGMILLGVWLLATRQTVGLAPVKGVTVNPKRSLGNAFLFGITYALASLGCTLPVFLVVVGGGLIGEGMGASLAQFAGYALGMGAVIFVVNVGAVLFRRALARWLRALTPHVHRLSAMFLIGAGAYLIYYWLM